MRKYLVSMMFALSALVVLNGCTHEGLTLCEVSV